MEPTITVRDVLLLLLEANSYPCLGNADWVVAACMETVALGKAESAVASADDPPEFARWLQTLRRTDLSNSEREEVYSEIHDYFEEGREAAPR